jgi:hypothetical protein
VTFKVHISTASSSTASVFHKHININTGNAWKCNRAEFQVLFIHTFFTIWSKMKQIQQNSFNPTSDNSEITVISHLKRVVPRPRVLLFYQGKSSISETGRSQGCIKNGLKPKCLWNLLTPRLPLHQLLQLRRLQTTKRTLIILKQQTKAMSKWNTPLISCTAQV